MSLSPVMILSKLVRNFLRRPVDTHGANDSTSWEVLMHVFVLSSEDMLQGNFADVTKGNFSTLHSINLRNRKKTRRKHFPLFLHIIKAKLKIWLHIFKNSNYAKITAIHNKMCLFIIQFYILSAYNVYDK